MEITGNRNKKTGMVYLAASILSLAFGLIYEAFGFGVTSPFMHFAFLIPLLAGAVPYLIAGFTGRQLPVSDKGALFWHATVATLTVGALFRGALDIYGTSSPLTKVYLIAGGVLFLLVPVFSRKHSAQATVSSGTDAV